MAGSSARSLAVLALILAGSPAASAQGTTSATPPPSRPPGCTTPMHRQFDFWIGEWTVTDSARTVVMGSNSVTLEDAGCTIHEHWVAGGPNPGTGQSLNAYDRNTGQWGQDWVGSGGNVAHLRGGLRDGSMVLESEVPLPNGGTMRQRITWTPKPDGRVRQHWETSRDGGKTWQTAFDGWYARRP
jgi:hypothetical protein